MMDYDNSSALIKDFSIKVYVPIVYNQIKVDCWNATDNRHKIVRREGIRVWETERLSPEFIYEMGKFFKRDINDTTLSDTTRLYLLTVWLYISNKYGLYVDEEIFTENTLDWATEGVIGEEPTTPLCKAICDIDDIIRFRETPQDYFWLHLISLQGCWFVFYDAFMSRSLYALKNDVLFKKALSGYRNDPEVREIAEHYVSAGIGHDIDIDQILDYLCAEDGDMAGSSLFKKKA